jgi:hypothetical protein
LAALACEASCLAEVEYLEHVRAFLPEIRRRVPGAEPLTVALGAQLMAEGRITPDDLHRAFHTWKDAFVVWSDRRGTLVPLPWA